MRVMEEWETEQIHGEIIGAKGAFVHFNIDAGLFSIFIMLFKAGFVYYAIKRPWISGMMAVVLALAFLFLGPYVDPHNNSLHACTMATLAAFVFSADAGKTLQASIIAIPVMTRWRIFHSRRVVHSLRRIQVFERHAPCGGYSSRLRKRCNSWPRL
ncbi:unnamed protein product [Prorocentrum cordatum]|uniref:Dolichyl-diphosphooligosaccharide--protein glycotransferase n=1 Tax=Prorocentrum cordatum TaxID=2364126 RepID=A0ABN9SUJ9_9DINO|nr:unnamed protein product [Polarella glacialis]